MSRSVLFALLRRVLSGLLCLVALPVAAQVIHTYDDEPGSAIALPDNGCATPVERTFVVGDAFTVSSIALGIEAVHPYRGNLLAVLVAPNGATATVLASAADPDDNYRVMLSANTEGARDDGDNDPAANVRYRRTVRVDALGTFYAGSAAGTWRLRICDAAAGNVGTYERARLVLRDDAAAPASACGSTTGFDWGGNGNQVAFTSQSVNGIGVSQGATSGEAPADGGSGIPSFVTETGTQGGHVGYYAFNMDTTGDTELSAETSELGFSVPVHGLTFSMLDVDRSNNAWEDYVRVEAQGPNGTVPYRAVRGSSQLSFAGDWVEADSTAAATATTGNVTYTFSGPVTTLRLQYAQGDQPASNSSAQYIGVSDLGFCALDFGDAPAAYATTFAANGPRHGLGNASLRLGAAPDGDGDGVPGAAANGDGADEDALTLPTLVSSPTPHFECGGYVAASDEFCVEVSVTNAGSAPAQLVGWFDANGDGDFADANERSLARLGNGSGGAGDATFATGNVPTGTSGAVVLVWSGMTSVTQADTYLRLRLTSDAGFFTDSPAPTPSGSAVDGEVEDHRVPAGSLPVTLSHVASQRVGSELQITFETASEIGNVGFRLVQRDGAGETPLHAGLVASERNHAAEPSRYRVDTAIPDSGRFFVREFDVHGRSKVHGPFLVGREYGAAAAQAHDWSTTRAAIAAQRASQRVAAGAGASVRLWVRDAGFQRVTHALLMAAGVDLRGVPVARIGLSYRGQPVPRRVLAATDTFDSASVIDFPLDPGESLYTQEFPVLLRVDGSDVEEIAIDPLRATAAVASWYWAESSYAPENAYNFASPTADPWYADRLLAYAGQPAALSRQIAFSAPAGTDGFRPELTVDLIGATDWPGSTPDHRVQVLVGGQPVADAAFDGPRTQQLLARPQLGVAGALDVEVRATGNTGFDYDLVYLDRIALRYPRRAVAEAGLLAIPQLNCDADAWAAEPGADDDGEGLLSSSFEGADEVPGLLAEGIAADAVGYAEVHGRWRALVAQDAPGGSLWPAAAGARYWIGAASVLATPRVDTLAQVQPLVSGSADYLVITHPLFAPHLAPLIARQQARGLDVRVVDVEQVFAQFNDHVPEAQAIQQFIDAAVAQMGVQYVLLVGADTYDYKNFLGSGSVSLVPTRYAGYGDLVRYAPADGLYVDRDADGAPEAAIGRLPVRSVAELQAWLAKSAASPAPKRALLVSPADEADAPFRSVHEGFAARWPAGWTLDRAYVDDVGLASVRTTLAAALDQRFGVLSYVGHSSPTLWSYDPLLGANDLAGHGGLADVVVQWGCWNSYFVAPTADTLAHAFLLTPGAGAAAVIGVTSLTDLKSHEALGNRLLPELVAGARVGDALRLAKLQLATQGERYRDILTAATLLGDPAQPMP